jgi:hypothetical protein
LPRAEIQRALYACRYLLHREEGIDLRLPHKPQGCKSLWRNATEPRSAKLTAFAVGSISMKIWS